MNRPAPIPSRCQSTPPLAGSPSGPTVPGDETVTPFGPVADIVGAPVRAFPHRLAKTVRDDESYNRLRAGQRDYALIERLRAEDARRRSDARDYGFNVFCILVAACCAALFAAAFVSAAGQL